MIRSQSQSSRSVLYRKYRFADCFGGIPCNDVSRHPACTPIPISSNQFGNFIVIGQRGGQISASNAPATVGSSPRALSVIASREPLKVNNLFVSQNGKETEEFIKATQCETCIPLPMANSLVPKACIPATVLNLFRGHLLAHTPRTAPQLLN